MRFCSAIGGSGTNLLHSFSISSVGNLEFLLVCQMCANCKEPVRGEQISEEMSRQTTSEKHQRNQLHGHSAEHRQTPYAGLRLNGVQEAPRSNRGSPTSLFPQLGLSETAPADSRASSSISESHRIKRWVEDHLYLAYHWF